MPAEPAAHLRRRQDAAGVKVEISALQPDSLRRGHRVCHFSRCVEYNLRDDYERLPIYP